jgi:hypothetical protein
MIRLAIDRVDIAGVKLPIACRRRLIKAEHCNKLTAAAAAGTIDVQ